MVYPFGLAFLQSVNLCILSSCFGDGFYFLQRNVALMRELCPPLICEYEDKFSNVIKTYASLTKCR